MANYNNNCSLSFDQYAVIYCENPSPNRNYFAIDEFDEFYDGIRSKRIVDANSQEFYERKVQYYGQFENYIDFIDPEIDLLTEIEFASANNKLPVRPFMLSSSD